MFLKRAEITVKQSIDSGVWVPSGPTPLLNSPVTEPSPPPQKARVATDGGVASTTCTGKTTGKPESSAGHVEPSKGRDIQTHQNSSG